MADELQASKQQHHAALAAEHKRKAEFHEAHAGGQTADAGQPSTGNAGSQIGGFVGAIGEHKWLIIGGGAAIIFLIIILRNNQSGNAAANQSPDYTQGGYVPSNIAASLDNINQQLSQIEQQQGGTSGGGGGTGNPPPGWPPPWPPPPGTKLQRPQGALFTNPSSGVLHYETTGSQSISQIAAQYGLKWQDIANIPENIRNFGRLSANSKPKADAGLVLPKKILGTNYYMVPTSGGQYSLAGIAQLENLSLARIEQLNPNIPTDQNYLLAPGEEVKIQ